MSVVCLICQKLFDNMITSTHLATHNIKTKDYVERFGKEALTSEQYRKSRSGATTGALNPNYKNTWTEEMKQQLSISKKGSVPWNKGKKLNDTDQYKQAAAKREERYKSGELQRATIVHSEETREKIATKIKEYAKNNHQELSDRAKKALITKKEKGVDLAFFRGRKHSTEAKEKIAKNSRLTNALKSKNAEQKVLEKINLANLSLLNSYYDEILKLKCNVCTTEFEHTHQLFHNSKFKIEICRVCFPRTITRSRGEKELFEFIKDLCPDAMANHRNLIRGEVDIFIPSQKLSIEYNGLYWHSELVLVDNGYDKCKDYKKYTSLQEKGIRCVTIFEDEWNQKQQIVKSRLIHILGKNNNRIFARKCIVRKIDTKTASSFCNLYHLQGKGRSNVRLGLYHGDQLVAVMTFSTSNLSRKVTSWELNRYCTNDSVIVGGASKLFQAFVREINPETVVSYADSRWSQGNLYKNIGFELRGNTSPNYWYFRPNEEKRIHRFSLRKNPSDQQDLTEWQNRQAQGWNRIWDCGNSKWVWTPRQNFIQIAK